jgi:alpha-L-rhamnosidase
MDTKRQWTGKWCWPRKHLGRPWNSYVYFRREVDLFAKPQAARIEVSADARYTLFVNGERVHQGPARGYPEFWSYDTLDISPFLKEGKNSICAIVHVFGVSNFYSVFRDSAGFFVDGEIEAGGKRVNVDTPGEWVCRAAKGWKKDVARMSIQLGFQEHFDADADPADWMLPEFEAKGEDGWIKPEFTRPVGYHPNLHFEERGVPLLLGHEHDFAEIVAQFRGENGRGYKITDDVYHFPVEETRKKDNELIEKPNAMLKQDEDVTIVQPPADGEFVAVTIDLGQYRTGHVQLDIAEAAGDEIIDIIYAETLDKAKFPRIVGTCAEDATGSEISTGDRYRCRAGAQKWETFSYRGMQYVGLIFRNVQKPLKIRHVGIRQVYAAVEDAGQFECSDEQLNAIWKVGRETQRNCLFDAFVDCPWREQAMWWGDARVQSKVTAFAFGDSSILERGIRLMARGQASDGSLACHPPADTPQTRLPDFMMTWVATIWDHYWQTGSIELMQECLPVMHRVFEFLKRHEEQDGLLGTFEGWWVFLDWAPLSKEKYSGVLNLMYLQAMRYAAAICELTGDSKHGVEYGNRAAKLTATVTKYFWNESAKVWVDGYDPEKKTQIDEISQHANTLAMMLHLKKEVRAKLTKEVLIKGAKQSKGKIVTGSPFFYAYILDALFEAGFYEELIEIIRHKWGEMIDAGATTFWEMWEVDIESHCHAWSSSPVYHLMQTVLGVRAMEPGWRRVRVSPHPGKLEFAKGVVPTPLGAIRVEWEKVGEDQLVVRVEMPGGMIGDFVGPMGETRQLKAGVNEFHT